MDRKHLIVLAAALLVLALSASWAYAEGVSPIAAITSWAKEQITSLWADFSDFMTDLQTDFIELVLSFVKAVDRLHSRAAACRRGNRAADRRPYCPPCAGVPDRIPVDVTK